MPERSRIFWVEDDTDYLDTFAERVEGKGHVVVERASTVEEAVGKIDKLGSLGVNVAIVDGNLTEKDTNGRDGENIASKIKSVYKDKIIVIGNPGLVHIKAADVNSPKSEGTAKLLETIRNA